MGIKNVHALFITTITHSKYITKLFYTTLPGKRVQILNPDLYTAIFNMVSMTASLVGKAGIAPLSVTVKAPQTFANLRASRSLASS